ncbi:phenylacetate--CoA ligase family protein [Autumnicola musiva]|uniref:AMP-binding protein n=1 Tax=Autumnicola musiva TaxID=3075589 RepID=A0ABU3D8J9_9FLAO|nr:AMP-binding protein [Zunongwangia sp. F117]MDT0677343.1 AMP-binding protein [Zunongwangia sp. F117]
MMKELYYRDTEKIRKKQWAFLREQLLYTSRNSPFYRELFRKHKIDLSRLASYNDFRRISLTTKEDLQQQNSEFISVAKEEIIDFVTTSGTLGDPVSLALNEADLERLATNEMKSFQMAGVKKQDVVQITTTLDRRFMAGMAYFLGLCKLGAGIVRTGSGLPKLQWDSIERFQPKYLVAVPSFLLKMIEFAEANGIDYRNSSVKAAICIGEPLRNEHLELNGLATRIRKLWNLELFSTYASTEMATAFTECEMHHGNHILSDLIFTEVLNNRGEPVEDGEIGELVVSPLQTRTMPLLRYATGDMVKIFREPCACGRNTPRLSPVIGRKKQMLKLKGTSVYPQQIINALNSFSGIESFVIEARTGALDTDELFIKISRIGEQELQEIKEHLKSSLQVTPQIEETEKAVIEELKFPKQSRKPQIFIDYR